MPLFKPKPAFSFALFVLFATFDAQTEHCAELFSANSIDSDINKENTIRLAEIFMLRIILIHIKDRQNQGERNIFLRLLP